MNILFKNADVLFKNADVLFKNMKILIKMIDIFSNNTCIISKNTWIFAKNMRIFAKYRAKESASQMVELPETFLFLRQGNKRIGRTQLLASLTKEVIA